MLMEDVQPPKEETDSGKYKIYVDMDGVLADFVVGVNKLMGGEYTDEKYKSDSKFRSLMWKTVREYSASGGRLWAGLPLMADAKALWSYVEKYNPDILTAAGDPKFDADQQKREWVPKNIGSDVVVNIVRKSADKQQFATPDSILIDDQAKSIDPWVAAGGIGILHTSAANTIAELKKLGL